MLSRGEKVQGLFLYFDAGRHSFPKMPANLILAGILRSVKQDSVNFPLCASFALAAKFGIDNRQKILYNSFCSDERRGMV